MYKKENILDFKLHDRIQLSPLKNPPASSTPPKPIYSTSSIEIQGTPSHKGTNTPHNTQENTFLKKKLVETHEKLLHQLEQGKNYQKEISEMAQQIERYKEKVAGLESKIQQLNNQIVSQYNASTKDYSSQMQELRKRMNDETLMKNKLGEENSKIGYELKNVKNHLIQLEVEIETKMKENRELENKLSVIRKSYESLNHQHELEMDKLRAKVNDSKKMMFQEGKETESEKKSLHRKIEVLQEQIYFLQEQNQELKNEMNTHQRDRSFSTEKNKLIDQLRYQINKGRAIVYEREQEIQDLRLKLKLKPYKKTYDDTRNLIQRLEHVQQLTRSRGLMKGASQSTLGRSNKTKTESESEMKKNKSRGKIINKVFSDD